MRYENGGALRGDQLAAGLGWFSIGLGLAEMLAPASVARLIGLPEGASTLRAFGAREMGNGVAILADPQRAGWMWARVGGDAVDLAYLIGQMGREDAERGRIAGAIAAVAGITALDIACAMKLNQPNGQEAADDHRRKDRHQVRVEQVVTINRPIEEVYRFWQAFENFPRFMRHLESVERIGPQRTRWRAKGPAGTSLEWEAETLQERENEWIAWRSVEGSRIDNSGSVRFQAAPGARGTELRVQLQYAPPAGRVGRTIARLFGEEPEQQIREDLHRFKQLMETGEIPVSDGPSLWRAAQPAADPGDLRTLAGVQR